jgi:hypothetical protein
VTICSDFVIAGMENAAMARKRGSVDPSLKSPVPLVAKRGRPLDPRRKCPVEERTCERHGVTEFARYSRGPNRGFRWCCKRCVGEGVTRRKQKMKRILVDEAGGCCTVCGYDRCIINLGFHHVDPKNKSFPMTMAIGRSLDAFREEAKKCVLVCANCHGEIEAGLTESPPLGASYATWGALRGRRGGRAA